MPDFGTRRNYRCRASVLMLASRPLIFLSDSAEVLQDQCRGACTDRWIGGKSERRERLFAAQYGTRTMDQSVGLRTNDRARAVADLTAFVATSIEAARASDNPFYHLEF